MDDLISRQAAIDAECEVCRIAPKKERGHNCTYYVHGCKEIECLRALPSAQPKTQLSTEDTTFDCISRQVAIDALGRIGSLDTYADREYATEIFMNLPSAQPEQTKMIKEIRKWINSGNRGSADYFIVDKIEEIINKYER